MKAPIVVAAVSLLLVVALLIWRSGSESQPVILSNAQAVTVMGDPGVVHVFLKIEAGDAPDRLISARSPDAQAVQIVSSAGVEQLAIPAQSSPALSSDGAYLRLSGLEGVLDEGRLIPLTLRFERSGNLTIQARVGEESDPHAMHRAMAEIAEEEMGAPTPVLFLKLIPTEQGATRVRLQTQNFSFDPGSDPLKHVLGHGHGHLYLDGLKLLRMYEAEALIGQLPPGRYEVRVTLNSNLHVPYSSDSGPASAAVELVVK